MVQGGEHGGSVAGPVATRILQRTLAMDAGTFTPQLAWLAPARKTDPFQMIAAVDYKDAEPNLTGEDEENPDATQNAENAQVAIASAAPDVEPEADAQGKVSRRGPRVARALPVAPQQRRPNFFQRLFGVKKQPPPAQPTPTPVRRPRRAF
jgi:hypothetical protein